MSNVETPELEKVIAVKETSQAIGKFLDWLEGEFEATVVEDVYDEEEDETNSVPVSLRLTREKLLALYFKIDLEKVEDEKQALLAELRKHY